MYASIHTDESGDFVRIELKTADVARLVEALSALRLDATYNPQHDPATAAYAHALQLLLETELQAQAMKASET